MLRHMISVAQEQKEPLGLFVRLEKGNRPPKGWLRQKVKTFEKQGGVTDPDALAGHIWYHRLSEGQRDYRTRKFKRKKGM